MSCNHDESLAHIERRIARVIELQEKLMSTLQDVKASVAAERTVVDSVATLLDQLSAKIADLAPNQADIDALAADVKSESDALTAAVLKNTPAQTK